MARKARRNVIAGWTIAGGSALVIVTVLAEWVLR